MTGKHKTMASSDHFAAVFKHRCISRPRNPDTNLPLTTDDVINDESSYTESSLKNEDRLLHERQLDEELERNRSDLNKDEDQAVTSKTEIGDYHSKLLENDLANLLQDDTKFYKHLQALRLENKKTLKMLEKFYHSRPRGPGGKEPKDFVTKMRNEVDAEKDALFAKKVYNSITNSNTEENEDNYSENDNKNFRSMAYDKHSGNSCFSITVSELIYLKSMCGNCRMKLALSPV